METLIFRSICTSTVGYDCHIGYGILLRHFYYDLGERMMMKKQLIMPLLAFVSMGLAGCASQPGQPGITNEQGGTVVGGILGGVLGSQIGSGAGKTAATIGGTLLGGFLGNRVGASMDQTARNKAEIAAQNSLNSGESQDWQGGNANGHFTPGGSYYNESGERCRTYSSTVTIDGKLHKAYGRACKDPQTGRWEIVR